MKEEGDGDNKQPLIIIGNGFDLECGLKSTYGAFFEYLVDGSSTTKNDKDNIWNHIFRVLHDVNSLVRFFRIHHPLMKYCAGHGRFFHPFP